MMVFVDRQQLLMVHQHASKISNLIDFFSILSLHCRCKPGFTGVKCENVVPPTPSHCKKIKRLSTEFSFFFCLVGAILGGVFGGLAFIALIVLGYIFGLPRLRRYK